MIVAVISAFFLVALGLAAKGLIVQSLVVAGAWLTKNILLLGFFRTKTGKNTAKAIRSQAYAQLNENNRRSAYRFFRFIARTEKKSVSALHNLFASRRPAPNPRVSIPLNTDLMIGKSTPDHPRTQTIDIPVESLGLGIYRLARRQRG